VSGIDLDVVGQWQELVVNAGVQQRGIFPRATRKIGTADRADKQRVACQQKPWIGAAPEVRSEQADAFG
jgi:hypothetical protein